MNDPFEHFGEQQQSFEFLEEHREHLAREAAAIVRQHPGAEPVGVVLDADATEAAEFRRLLQEQSGQEVRGFVGVMPRHLVLQMLRSNAPQTLDFLEPSSTGPKRRLPLVAVTRNGFRLGAVEYDVIE